MVNTTAVVLATVILILSGAQTSTAGSTKNYEKIEALSQQCGSGNCDRMRRNAVIDAENFCSDKGGARQGGQPYHFDCAPDGNLYCKVTGRIECNGVAASSFPVGWYGFENSKNKDREKELPTRCSSTYRRIVVNQGTTFDALCNSIGRRCKKVCDWEGNTKGCNDSPYSWGDGARIAYCE